METSSPQKLLACRHCDLLQHEVVLHRHHDAHCVRCGALLYRGTRARLDWMIALVLASAILLLVSNLFPIAALEKYGTYHATTLAGTVLTLYYQDRPLVAALVLGTAILVPALELCALLYMLLPLRACRIAPGLAYVFRFVLAIHRWSMMEVFLLALLVTLAKLSDLATIVPGIALWAFAGLIASFSAVAASFSARDFWGWVDAIGAEGRP
ncbi:paraquat-inducible protein A [Noviherbaspirillum sp. UKPF54]|uniref:paraquat-inducible protein A n=1 Tax=Noviherbaspirillum sp. UKPF54 TaxID=2601898 RepID=UPI0011B11375|nr:paraquat-inducible protein A [Noviherbaspirillum sp. UKPF54]QDZ30084.1 paraquat-inducible protein A [Noviherbaspirillum sp. UKPF54]